MHMFERLATIDFSNKIQKQLGSKLSKSEEVSK